MCSSQRGTSLPHRSPIDILRQICFFSPNSYGKHGHAGQDNALLGGMAFGCLVLISTFTASQGFVLTKWIDLTKKATKALWSAHLADHTIPRGHHPTTGETMLELKITCGVNATPSGYVGPSDSGLDS